MPSPGLPLLPDRPLPGAVNLRLMSNITRALDDNARRAPEKNAVTGSRKSLTWRELHDEVAAVAARLQDTRTLGLLMENSPAWIVTDLSAIHAGVVNIPLPGFFSDEQLRHAIRDGQIDTVITDNPARMKSLLPDSREVSLEIAGKPCVQMFFPVDGTDEKHSNTVKVTYTSGTTGTPRGVQLSLKAIETVTDSLAEAACADREDRALVLLPLSILLENIGSVYVPILAGAEIIVPDSGDLGLSGSSQIDAAIFAAALQSIRPTAMILPPQLLKLLVVLGKQHALPDSFRFIAVGGAPVGIALLDAARELGLPVYQGYGLSEACSVVALNTAENNRMGSVGRLLAHNKVRINEDGEIVIIGETFNGYLNGNGRNTYGELATGDLGYLDEDGYLYVTGRSRDRIITGFGRNISPEWIESEFLSHPLIVQAVVFGNNMPCLAAVLVLAQHDPQDVNMDIVESAMQEVNERLPDYARVRDYVIADAPFSVASGELSASGSPRRAAIEQHYFGRIEHQAGIQNEHFL
jgi:long-chain acyl-CoA synthetase